MESAAWRLACWRRRARSSGEGLEGEAGLGVGNLLGGSVVGEDAGVGLWMRGDGGGGFAVGLRGVLKGDLKGLERASVLSRRRRLKGGRADIVGGGFRTVEN